MIKIRTDGTTERFRTSGIKTNELEQNENHKYKKNNVNGIILNRNLTEND